jgi:hypothetical protein
MHRTNVAILTISFCIGGVCGGLAQAQVSALAHPEIWMWGSPTILNKPAGWEGVRADAGELWKPDAPWQTVASSVKVIQMPPGNIERARESDLKEAIADIKRRKFSLAVATGLLIRSDRCRAKTEAYVDRSTLERLFDKLRRNGGDVQYVTMDEPFYYGHKDSSPTACHESARALAQALVESIAIVRKYFPNARIGSDEPLTKELTWVDELAAWVDTYQQVTGEKLAYLHADLTWKPGSAQNLVSLGRVLEQRHVPLGIIYDASAKGDEPWFDPNSVSNSNIGWVRNAIRHFTEVETEIGVHPEHAVIETWVHYPSRMLPENEPGTLTNLVLQYIQRH